MIWRRLVGQWRKRRDLRAGIPPAVQYMWIDEREGDVPRERYALSWRPQPGGKRRDADRRVRVRNRYDPIQVKVSGYRVRERIELRAQILRLFGLDQPQVALR